MSGANGTKPEPIDKTKGEKVDVAQLQAKALLFLLFRTAQETVILRQWKEWRASLINPLRQNLHRMGRSFDPAWAGFMTDLSAAIDSLRAK